MTGRTAGSTGIRAGRPAVRRWSVPSAQALLLAVVLFVDVQLVTAARADLQAERGIGPVIPAAAVDQAVAPPVTLGVADLGLSTRLIGLRKERSGALGVPEDPQRAGWYSQGPAPGDDGPAVIVGHVDSVAGPGVFAGLRTLPVGTEIGVRRADGSLVIFRVTEIVEYSKRDFPTDRVYRGDGRPSLRLITCGGEFDRAAGHYRSNVVVFAELVATV